jgi:hypothetical protein
MGKLDHADLLASLRGRNYVLCSLSRAREQMVLEDPELIDSLLDARTEQTIRGLLDLGMRVPDLALALGETLAEAVHGYHGKVVAGAEYARLIDRASVAQLARSLGELGPARVHGKLGDDLTAVVKLYADAAERGESMLVIGE